MSKYYTSNNVYERIAGAPDSPFLWVSGNAWALVYGDAAAVPKLLVFARGNSFADDPHFVSVVSYIAERTAVPFFQIRFDDQSSEIHSVEFQDGGAPILISMAELKERFRSVGLPVTSGTCGKFINSQSSSAYHDWQRSTLGQITVADIDLIRLEKNFPIEVIELKRSFYDLSRWKPFKEDYKNFNLLFGLCEKSAPPLKLTIAYNVRQKNPFVDDASRLSIFDFGAKDYPTTNAKSPLSFEAFLRGDYLC